MARESYRSTSTSTSMSTLTSKTLMRGPITRSTTIPPSLNRQNSHTARQECSNSSSSDATTLLFKVASASQRSSPRNSPPASPSHRPRDPIDETGLHERDIQWDFVSRRLSDKRQEGYISFPDFDRFQAARELDERRSSSGSSAGDG